MNRFRTRKPWSATILALVVASLFAVGGSEAGAASAEHWGPYQWGGGSETADIRAFWLVDRTGDETTSFVIKAVADAWNAAREDHPELPFIAVYKDTANTGACFINTTPGYSVASACMLPFRPGQQTRSLSARTGDEHLTGAAFAISPGLTPNENVTAVCHAFGYILGLDNSDDSDSCMKPVAGDNELVWYNSADADAILELYDHDENGTTTSSSSSTSSSSPTTTTTGPGGTTTTTEAPPATTTTTEAPATTTTSVLQVSTTIVVTIPN